MKHLWKILACLVPLALLAYLLLIDYPEFRAEAQHGHRNVRAHITYNAVTIDERLELTERQALEQEIAAAEGELSELEERVPPAVLAVGFYHTNESLYDDVYEKIGEDYAATVVLHSGQLTSGFDPDEILAYEGWDFAIGRGEQQAEEEQTLEEWNDWLGAELKQLDRKADVAPSAYCFAPGEYRPEYDDVLLENGITTAIIPAEDADRIRDAGSSYVSHIVSFSLSDDIGAERILAALADGSYGMLMAQDYNKYSARRYAQLLAELDESGAVRLTTLAAAVEEFNTDSTGRRQLLAEIEEKRAQLAELESQLENETVTE